MQTDWDPTLESYILVYRNIQIAYRGQLYSTKDPFRRCLDFCNNFSEILGIVDGDWVHEDGLLTNAWTRDSQTAHQGLCNLNKLNSKISESPPDKFFHS